MATPQRGSGFVGLDKYLAANRNAAKRMSDTLAGTVEAQGADAEGAYEDIQKQFMRDVWAGMPHVNESGEPLTPDEIRTLIHGKYTGPSNLSDMSGWGDVQDKAGKAAQSAAGLTSLAGRQVALQDQYGKEGGYSPGQQRFDSFLSGAAGGGRFQELKDKYGALSDGLGGANAASQQVAKTASEGVKATADKWKKVYSDAADKAAASAEKNKAIRADMEKRIEDRKRRAKELEDAKKAGRSEASTHSDVLGPIP